LRFSRCMLRAPAMTGMDSMSALSVPKKKRGRRFVTTG
jgi:hypothetical protein